MRPSVRAITHLNYEDARKPPGPQANLNLRIKTCLNRAPVSNIVLDTSTTSTDTIDYVVTDQHQKPRGSVDYADCTTVSGWVQDQDTPDMTSDVHFYIDGQFAGTMTEAAKRDDLCSVIGSCYHGFTWTVPSQFRSSGTHAVSVFGIDTTASGNNAELPHSPKTFQCTQ